MSSQLLRSQRHYLRIISRWPADLIRPESVSVPTAIRNHIAPFVASNGSSESSNLKSNDAFLAQNSWNEERETAQANALYSLLENKYQNKYPVPKSLRKPASQPSYYDDLLKELDEAPKRGWLGRFINSWKGFFRVN